MLYLFLAILHVVFILLLSYGAEKWLQHPANKNEFQPEIYGSVLIVIPARNEAQNLPNLLNDLAAQEGIEALDYHIIVVDDESEDETLELARKFQQQLPLTILSNGQLKKSIPSPKKRAILNAIANQETADIIITTDADCRLKPTWLQEMLKPFGNSQTQMVCGMVAMEGKNGLFEQIQEIEFYSLIATGMGTLSFGYASMCNGANLAYRKSAFQKVGGFSGLELEPSGDDEFLMHRIAKAFPEGGVFYTTNINSMAITQPADGLNQFINQRKRWSSKWKKYENSFPTYLATWVGCLHMAGLLSFPLLALGELPLNYFLSYWALTIGSQWYYVKRFAHFQHREVKAVPLAITLSLYAVYAAYFAFLGIIGSSYTWKGRRFGYATLPNLPQEPIHKAESKLQPKAITVNAAASSTPTHSKSHSAT